MSKVALVTGASRGIGSEIAVRLAQSGFSVAVNYFSSDDKARELLSSLKLINPNVNIYKADVANALEVSRMIHKIESDFGAVNIAVNNAGISHIGLFTDMSEYERNRLISVNLLGAMNISKAVLPDMIRRKDGNIINISSIWGEIGASCEVVYSASKAGLIGFTKALAKEVGPSGIRVNCVSPGVIDTDMNSAFSEADIDALADSVSLCRIGKPDEVADVVDFLASDRASYINGQVVSVNGG